MVRKCPKCGDYSLDYDPDFKKWRCSWVGCFYEEEDFENLKQMVIDEYERKGRVGVYRFYYGKKTEVVEFDGNLSGMKFFWDSWKKSKDALKQLGFGVWKEETDCVGFGYYTIFCNVEKILEFEKEKK